VASPDISRGEIWWVNWSPGRGSEQTGRRPALVVQTNAANRNPRYPNTIVVALSARGREVPFHVRLEPTTDNGLTEASFAKCEQILTVSKARLEERLGRVAADDLGRVASALLLVLSI
jgi:mRNA interferase MazF